MGNPLVSAIIPCYNQAQYVAQAVRSVLDQTYQPVEVIVVDDGSPDDVAAALAPFADDPRVRLIRQANQGVSAARNTGITAARGTYLQFVDADDWLHLEKLARQVPILEADPTIGLMYTDFYTIGPDGQFVEGAWTARAAIGPHEPDMFDTLWLNNCIGVVTVLARADWIKQVGGFTTTREFAEDHELWLRLAGRGCPFSYLPEFLGYYRKHPTNRSKGQDAKKRWIEVRSEIARQFPERVGSATDAAVRTLIGYWNDVQGWAGQQEQAIEEQQAQIAALLRENQQLHDWAEQQREAIEDQQARIAALEQQLAEVRGWAEQQREAIEWHARHGAILEEQLATARARPA